MRKKYFASLSEKAHPCKLLEKKRKRTFKLP
jgi:hypothetical protein